MRLLLAYSVTQHTVLGGFTRGYTVHERGLTFKSSTFCPHSVFMCFVLISEQTAIISLYKINWLVFFITETECVYCAVRTGCLNGLAVTQAVSQGLLNTLVHFRLHVSQCANSGRQSDTLWRVFPSVLRLYPLSIIPGMLHTYFLRNVSRTKKTQGRDRGTCKQANLLQM